MAPTEDLPMGKRLNCPDCPKIESAKPHKRRYSDYSGLPGIWHPQKIETAPASQPGRVSSSSVSPLCNGEERSLHGHHVATGN